MAPRVLDGWQATETHEHFDADGNLTGRTVVTREPEWDERSVAEMYALHEADDLICPECGNLREHCADPTTSWYPQRHICWASASREAVQRRWRDKHRDAKPNLSGLLPTDGVRVWVSRHDLTPDDHFL